MNKKNQSGSISKLNHKKRGKEFLILITFNACGFTSFFSAP